MGRILLGEAHRKSDAVAESRCGEHLNDTTTLEKASVYLTSSRITQSRPKKDLLSRALGLAPTTSARRVMWPSTGLWTPRSTGAARITAPAPPLKRSVSSPDRLPLTLKRRMA